MLQRLWASTDGTGCAHSININISLSGECIGNPIHHQQCEPGHSAESNESHFMQGMRSKQGCLQRNVPASPSMWLPIKADLITLSSNDLLFNLHMKTVNKLEREMSFTMGYDRLTYPCFLQSVWNFGNVSCSPLLLLQQPDDVSPLDRPAPCSLFFLLTLTVVRGKTFLQTGNSDYMRQCPLMESINTKIKSFTEHTQQSMTYCNSP